jgi:diacylglycerol kinase (ATP)
VITRGPLDPVHFCCAAGAGLDAEVARRANSLPAWLRARGGYFLAAIAALASYPAQTFTVTASDRDGRPCRTLAETGFLVAFANAPWYGHGMRIAPQASLDDGEVDVCFVRAMSRLRLLGLFPKVYRGKHVGLPEVEYFRAPRLRIESEQPLAVHADGEPAGTTPVEISVLPRALQVILGTSI